MRTAVELIEELDEENKHFHFAAIVVAIEKSYLVIPASEDDRLQKLTEAIKCGGLPMGLVVVVKEGQRDTFCSRVYPEITGELATAAKEELRMLNERMAKHLEQTGFGKISGWLIN